MTGSQTALTNMQTNAMAFSCSRTIRPSTSVTHHVVRKKAALGGARCRASGDMAFPNQLDALKSMSLVVADSGASCVRGMQNPGRHRARGRQGYSLFWHAFLLYSVNVVVRCGLSMTLALRDAALSPYLLLLVGRL